MRAAGPHTSDVRALGRGVCCCLLGLAACAARTPLALELPSEALSAEIGTVILAVEVEGRWRATVFDRTALDAATLARDAPRLDEWDGEAASLWALGLAGSPGALDLALGPALAPGEEGTLLPEPAKSFRTAPDDEAWEAAAAPASLRALPFAPAFDCRDVRVVPERFPAITAGPNVILATGDGTALFDAETGAGTVVLERLRDGGFVEHPSSETISRLAKSGDEVLALDVVGALKRLDLHGVELAMGRRGAFDGIIGGHAGGAFAWDATRLYELVRGSTRARALDLPPFPEPPRHVAVYDASHVIILGAGRARVLERGAWSPPFEPQEQRLHSVDIDEDGAYAANDGVVYERVPGGAWEAISERTANPWIEVRRLEGGRLAVTGQFGRLAIRPRRGRAWCDVETASVRWLEYVAVEPEGRALYVGDNLDAMQGAFVARVELPLVGP